MRPHGRLLNPFFALEASLEDLKALAQLCDEDASLDDELGQELTNFEKKLADFELRAMLSGPQDASHAFVKQRDGNLARGQPPSDGKTDDAGTDDDYTRFVAIVG